MKLNIVLALIIAVLIIFKLSPAFAEVTKAADLYYKNIIPGVTSEADALKIMGQSKKTRENPDGSLSHIYESKKAGFPHEMTIKKAQIVHMAIAVADTSELNISEVKKVLGEIERAGFSYYAFNLRVAAYPKHGMVFIYDEATGAVCEKQYFAKCSVDEFEKGFGKNFPKEYPYKM